MAHIDELARCQILIGHGHIHTAHLASIELLVGKGVLESCSRYILTSVNLATRCIVAIRIFQLFAYVLYAQALVFLVNQLGIQGAIAAEVILDRVALRIQHHHVLRVVDVDEHGHRGGVGLLYNRHAVHSHRVAVGAIALSGLAFIGAGHHHARHTYTYK